MVHQVALLDTVHCWEAPHDMVIGTLPLFSDAVAVVGVKLKAPASWLICTGIPAIVKVDDLAAPSFSDRVK
jgi:hypothetical protein